MQGGRRDEIGADRGEEVLEGQVDEELAGRGAPTTGGLEQRPKHREGADGEEARLKEREAGCGFRCWRAAARRR